MDVSLKFISVVSHRKNLNKKSVLHDSRLNFHGNVNETLAACIITNLFPYLTETQFNVEFIQPEIY